MVVRFTAFLVLLTVLIGLFAVGLPNGHSASFNYPWAQEYINTFDWNNPLPRHLPGLWRNQGGYDFFFYAPLPFWLIASSIDPICQSCSIETKIVAGNVIFWLLGSYFCYQFLARFVHTSGAVIGATVYSVLPYHLIIDWFIRQAIGEFCAYAFIPLAAYGFEEIRTNGRRKYLFSIGVAGLVLCHLPTAFLAAHFVLVAAVISAFDSSENGSPYRSFIITLFKWGSIGLLISAFYWLPAVALRKLVSIEQLYTLYFHAENWLFGGKFDQPNSNFMVQIVACIAVSLPLLLIGSFASKGSLRIWIIAPATIVIFLNSEASELLWRNWEIRKVQFPFRSLVFLDFAVALATGAIFALARPIVKFTSLLLVTGAVFLVWSAVHATNKNAWRGFDAGSTTIGAVEYLSPETLAALSTQVEPPFVAFSQRMKMDEVIASNQSQIHINSVGQYYIDATARKITVQPLIDNEKLQLPIQYWSLWSGYLEDGNYIKVVPNKLYGTIDLMPPEGGFQGRVIHLTLKLHWSEKVGMILSISTIFVLLLVYLRSWIHNRTITGTN
ncbi:hypothetical protein [Cognatishimia activa]|uniref:Membrane protein 6-pyruvoyl-tetrahydropterin synthase-related domain-containing protein n=1 Tax=Cognatishimia activa TaxID=1715691 RepID=A0A0P1ILC2_9RHOB|nr:hypothetical protein [Cognatishimia activa]CUI57593.1 hypothetical protein TA5113_00834 [Cognatishimia activa]CUK24426.1 hypothetical protein TA5114_00209 [Cognatishimia activa]